MKFTDKLMDLIVDDRKIFQLRMEVRWELTVKQQSFIDWDWCKAKNRKFQN